MHGATCTPIALKSVQPSLFKSKPSKFHFVCFFSTDYNHDPYALYNNKQNQQPEIRRDSGLKGITSSSPEHRKLLRDWLSGWLLMFSMRRQNQRTEKKILRVKAISNKYRIGGQIGIQIGSQFSGGLLQKQNASFGISASFNIFPSLLTNVAITPANPAHNGRVCSTWGNFHFKTFDGDIFTFPGLCNYVFASHCNAPYEDFNIQIRREVVANTPTINRITMKLEVQLPYSQSGITIEKSSIYVKVGSKIGVVLLWNEKDSILLELNEKYANQTCGLCGDFNGFPIYNEFISNNIKMTALQFGNLQKMDGPTEHCEDATSIPTYNCSDDLDDICEKTLTSSAFADCNDLVDVKDYIKACQDDLCSSEESKNSSCICDTIAEYSRQCAHAGGQPLDWRTSKLCPKTCPYNMQYQECNSPCTDTCTNPERSLFCEEHCIDGCFCPPGKSLSTHISDLKEQELTWTVFDDINNSGCIPQQECSCIYNGKTYATGASFSEPCQTCTCNGGQWSCQDKSCPGTCSVVGGSHISTYDTKHYDHHGDCTYVLSKDCTDEKFTILAELRKCGLTDTETCLKSVTLNMNKGQTLPISAANVTMFRPSSFFMIMDTSFGVQVEVQFTPVMQVFVRLDASFKNQTCGLCGNFNNIQSDDFKVISGIIEGTASAFANTWKTQASCPNIQQSFENPCALSIDNEKYAQHWCGLLTDSTGPFAACHYAVNPTVYHTNCMFDTCNCENSEDCLCAALSAYVRACAAKGIQLQGWRADVCTKYTTSCPKSLSYSYTISSCQPTCRSLSEPDVTCNIKFVPVDGCTCVNGTYMDESGKCVPANECPCYYKGSPIPFGEVVHENGLCESPMVYFDCKNSTAGTTGAECQKSCQTLDMQCYSSQCTSGCICPDGLVLDGNGGCIPEEECPCIHNEATYQPGEKIDFDCNTCVCKNRKWECTKDQCLGTCAVYGDGHYNTFDDKRFSFNGNCEYTLVQDHCGKSGTVNGTFRVATENVPCGNTGTTCSKSIKVFLESYELILGEERVSVVKRGQNDEVPYTVRYMGMYLVIETKSGLILMWDKKTSIFIKLSPRFKGQVCGLCGNYDGNSVNDFTTRSQSVVENVLEFGNSWKVSSTCPDAASVKDPCSTNPYRKSWSEKQCSIINSNVFAACHSQVEPAKYYQACVTDACACDTGGDCDCFCTAVAAYAQACSEVGVCIAWRSPTICPLFCDYYNQQGECEWHYKPCGASCMKTCKNPSGKCLNDLPGLEGCYPNCPPDKPYFHEDQMKCVSLCDCYDDEDGKIYQRDECSICECTSEGLQCKFDDKACNCIYEGNSYKYGELIYNTTDGTGWCFSATCDVNGTISRNIFKCGIFTTTPFTFSTSQPTTTVSEITTATPVTTVCVKNVCVWSEWYDSTQPENKEDSGDYETYQNLKNKGYSVCTNPSDVQCRAKEYPDTEITNLNQTIECSQSRGLICNNQDQESKQCYNYEIRISCCRYVPCSEAQTTTPTTTREFTTTAVESTPFTVQTTIIPTTQKQESEVTTTPMRERDRTTPQSETSVTATTTQVSTTGYQITTTTAGTSTVVTQAPSSPNTFSTLPGSTLQTTPGTTITSSTTALPTQGTTITTPGPRVPTQGTTSASTTTTAGERSTQSTEGTLPTVLSTVAVQTTSTIAASTPEIKIKTTIGTTVGPSTTGSATEETTIIATTTSTSPPQTEGTTIIIPTTTREPTSATSTASTSRTTERSTTRASATSAPRETSTVTTQAPTSPTTPSEQLQLVHHNQAMLQQALLQPSVLPPAHPLHPAKYLHAFVMCLKLYFLLGKWYTTEQIELAVIFMHFAARNPGEEWIEECQKCVCDSLTATAQCQPLPCQTAQQTTCDLGFVSMAVIPQKDPCCPEFECKPIPDVCVINGTLYTVGKSVVIDSCKKCTCSSEKDPETNANIMHCETVQCETSCPLGYQYMIEEGECCGKCIEVACKVKLSNNTVHVLNVNEILPLDQCSHYKCEKIEDQFVAVQTKRVCPEHDPEECDPDETEITSDGCCKICKPKTCKPYTKETVIRHADCESSGPVQVSYCEGTCPSSSMYSLEANQMEHKCGCCQELSTQTRDVTLTCQNGTSINYTYLYVENCQCYATPAYFLEKAAPRRVRKRHLPVEEFSKCLSYTAGFSSKLLEAAEQRSSIKHIHAIYVKVKSTGLFLEEKYNHFPTNHLFILTCTPEEEEDCRDYTYTAAIRKYSSGTDFHPKKEKQNKFTDCINLAAQIKNLNYKYFKQEHIDKNYKTEVNTSFSTSPKLSLNQPKGLTKPAVVINSKLGKTTKLFLGQNSTEEFSSKPATATLSTTKEK
ncbi:hypothetical protein EK904_007963 [Melospiza melodia maxima]|nr:hypothetical protein EK904_007963 [Melospiza melodia maxima]